jgi:hypothetical protein
VNPPYQFAPEDNLSYAAAIRVEQLAIAKILRDDPHPVILTAWPVSDYLQRPELGYVTTPLQVTSVPDFTPTSMLQARRQQFTAALMFTTLNPSRIPLSDRLFGRANREYFGLHDDAPAPIVARILGGTLVWEKVEQRQYAGVIREDAAVDATLAPIARPTPVR